MPRAFFVRQPVPNSLDLAKAHKQGHIQEGLLQPQTLYTL